MNPASPGRFTRAAIHSEAGEIEARLSAKGNWQLRIRPAGANEWRLVCSGDLEGGEIIPLPEPELPLRLGPLSIDGAARRVLVDGAEVRLRASEFDLLRTLASQPNRVFSKQELLRAWAYPEGCRTHSVDHCARRLRLKLRKAGADGLIVNYPRVGYRLWSGVELVSVPPSPAA